MGALHGRTTDTANAHAHTRARHRSQVASLPLPRRCAATCDNPGVLGVVCKKVAKKFGNVADNAYFCRHDA